jgi:hypothetical protein
MLWILHAWSRLYHNIALCLCCQIILYCHFLFSWSLLQTHFVLSWQTSYMLLKLQSYLKGRAPKCILNNYLLSWNNRGCLPHILKLFVVINTWVSGQRRTSYPSLDAFVASLHRRRPHPQSTPEQAEGTDWMKTGAVPLRPLRCKMKALSKSTGPMSSLHRVAQVRFSPL